MKLSLTSKIFLAFAMMLATFALLAFYSVKEFRGVQEDLRSISDGLLVLARLAGQIETHQQNRLRDMRRGLAEPDPRSREVVLRIAAAYFPEVVRSRVEEVRNVCRIQLGRIEPGHSEQTKVDFYQAIQSRIDRIGQAHEGADELTEALLQRVRTGAGTQDLEQELDRLETVLRTEVYQLNKDINDETGRAVKRAEADEQNATWRVLVSTALALLIGALLTVLSARALAPIRDLVTFARAISRGDYEMKVTLRGEDELAALWDELVRMAQSRKEREAELDRQQAELERAYHRVAELKRYNESVVHSLRTAVVVTDRELLVTSTNRAAETRFGLTEDQIRRRPLASLPFGPSLAERLGSLDALIARAEPVFVTALPVGERMADVAITPFRGESGAVLGLVLAIEDVTEAVRTKEALIRSERLAAIGRMSAHVTHEVRNPLASIGLNAELLEAMVAEIADRPPVPAPTRNGSAERSPPVDEAQALCRAIEREVDRLTAITEEYLRFARLPRPELEARDLAELLRGIASFVRIDVESSKVQLDLQLPETSPPVEVDADQIRQAVLNLVRNAKESMPEGGRLSFGLELSEDEAVILVGDTGVGIAEENLDRIFDPFYSTKLTGTGLGLALCQQIVVEHGGELLVRSRVGHGSEFRIALPLRQKLESAKFSGQGGARPPPSA